MGEITSQSMCFSVIILLSFCQRVKGKRSSLGYKNAVKTMHSDGDLIDFVDIYKQSAFDQPLLKNHTIQVCLPSWYPNEAIAEPKISSKDRVVSSQVWNKFEECPKGTIRICIIQRNDNVDPEFVRAFGEKSMEGIPFPKKEKYGDQNAEYAGMYVKDQYFYGASQYSSVWNPQVEVPTVYSAAATWLFNNEGETLRLEQDGWYGSFFLFLFSIFVKPSLFGDNRTRLFVSWNISFILFDHGLSIGCYNLFCLGFIQTNSKVVLGGFLTPILMHWDCATDLNDFKDNRYSYDSQIMSLFMKDAFYFGGPGRSSSCM
ncbi:hypothetical protein AMTRI_Chr06g171110 [Amborella trichopoda]